MPRKQNGLGKFKSFNVRKANDNFKVPEIPKSSGTYPSVRRFGTRITKTAIEKFNIDALYARWRRAYEYYTRNAFNDLDVFFPVTFFTNKESELLFNLEVKRFASSTGKPDTAVHYTVKRLHRESLDYSVATIDQVFDNSLLQIEEKERKELWCSLNGYAGLLHLLVNEEVQSNINTNNRVGATVRMLFDDQKRPNVFTGNTGKNTSSFVYSVPKSDFDQPLSNGEPSLYQKEGVEGFIGKVAIPRDVPNFMPIDSKSTYEDDAFQWYFNCVMENMPMSRLLIVDPEENTDAQLAVIGNLVGLSRNATASMADRFMFLKEPYQPYFKNRYITAELIGSYMEWMSFPTPPLFIMEAREDGDTLLFKTVPIEMQLDLHGNLEGGYVAFGTNSFTKYYRTTEERLNPVTLKKEIVEIDKLILDLDPYFLQGESFKSGDVLALGEQYTCSCPSYSHANVRSPQQLYQETKDRKKFHKKNRQDAYPMPSAGSNKNPEGLSEQVSGIINSWKSMSNIMSFSCCKHTISLMFLDDYKVQEPKTYLAMKDRLKFEELVMKEFEDREVPPTSVSRAEINQSVDLSWAICQQIQLSDTELGSIINGQSRARNNEPPVVGRVAQMFKAIDPITKVTIEES
nr:hypothetical protein 8 [Paracoccaceae bacterium]